MNVVVTIENRFSRTPDGAVWTSAQFAYPFWTRYLAVFEQVRVVARVQEVLSVPADWKLANGAGVSFAAVPHYIGLWQYLRRIWQVQRTARKAVKAEDAVILRVSSQIAASLEPVLQQDNHPYGVEVVTDPYGVFAPPSFRHPLQPFFRWWFPRRLRRQCAEASAAAYVTEQALQANYPPAPDAFSTYYSDVELSAAAFSPAARFFQPEKSTFKLVFVGTLAQLYKAPDVLIEAMALCVRAGLDLKLVMVGDGRYQPQLEAQAAALGVGERVCFLGQLSSREAVNAQLDRADLFVLPSYQEGLPRAMIEAMARALPCVGSTVGGMPELLPPEDMVPAGDAAALAGKICEIVTDPQRMAGMSARNLQKAREYKEEVMCERRNVFYRHLRERTEAWVQARQK